MSFILYLRTMNKTWRDENHVKILETCYLTHDVKRIRVTKPEGYQFTPGEATDMVINEPGWLGNRHAFTFTGLNEWNFLEFTIKIYQSHKGFTNQLDQLKAGDELIIHDSFGAFHYRSEGTFIAGGAGVTPFIAILRQLEKENRIQNNRLIFSNKTSKDIILKEEFEKMLGTHFINTLTREKTNLYDNRKIDKSYLQQNIKDYSQYFYICGSRKMMTDIRTDLISLGATEDKVIIEMDFNQQVLE